MSLMRLYSPLTLQDMARRTVQIYVRGWPQWLALAALVLIPLAIINGAAMLWMFDQLAALDPALAEALLTQPPEQIQALLLDPDVQEQLIQAGTGLMGFMAALIASQIVQGIVLGGAGSVLALAFYRGQTASVGAALGTALGRRGVALITGHLLVWFTMVALVGAGVLVICLGILLLIVMVSLYLVYLPLLPPVLALEEGPLSRLLARAWYFVKKRIWLMLAASVTFMALRFALNLPLTLALGPLLNLLGPVSDGMAVASGQVADLIVQAITVPLGVIFFALLYEDSQTRLAASAEGQEAVEEYGPPPEPLLTANDLPKLAGVFLVVVVGGFFVLQALTMVSAILSAF